MDPYEICAHTYVNKTILVGAKSQVLLFKAPQLPTYISVRKIWMCDNQSTNIYFIYVCMCICMPTLN